jgi:ribonuclease HII
MLGQCTSRGCFHVHASDHSFDALAMDVWKKRTELAISPPVQKASIFAGIDEAGLGPTLGPLAIGALLLEVEPSSQSIAERLADVVGPPQTKAPHLEVGDSKLIYSGSRKLARLERSVLATLGWLHGSCPSDTHELFNKVASFPGGPAALPWYPIADALPARALPLAAQPEEVARFAEALREAGARTGIRPLAYAGRLLTEEVLNRECEAEALAGGSKNTWSTHHTLDHAFELLMRHECAWRNNRIRLACDRAGGRADYRGPVERALESQALDYRIAKETKGQGVSHYHLHPNPESAAVTPSTPLRARIELSFQVGAENVDLCVAWGSMLAKYLRELIMFSFAAHWQKVAPDVRPTAGYPQDAARFLGEVGDLAPWERHKWIRSR